MIEQMALNSAIAAGLFLLVAFGFGLLYRVCGFFSFSYAGLIAAAPYITLLLESKLALPLAIAAPLSTVATAGLGCLIEVAIYKRLRERGSSSFSLLLASLAVYIVIQNAISILSGDYTMSIRTPGGGHIFTIGEGRITFSQLAIVCVSVGFMIVLSVSAATPWGLRIRSVASDPGLAALAGVDVSAVTLWAVALGSWCAGVAGVLIALDVDMTPSMGMPALMIGVVVLFVGGVGSIPGQAIGAIVLAISRQVAAWNIGSQWQDVVSFLFLITLLIARPEGLLAEHRRALVD
jgi:branched-chain amino acid transport system permease protein